MDHDMYMKGCIIAIKSFNATPGENRQLWELIRNWYDRSCNFTSSMGEVLQ